MTQQAKIPQRAPTPIGKLATAKELPVSSDQASKVWNSITGQLKNILGKEIFEQWFVDVIPISLKNNVLTLQTSHNFNAMWINNNYLELVDLLLGYQREETKAFFQTPTQKGNS